MSVVGPQPGSLPLGRPPVLGWAGLRTVGLPEPTFTLTFPILKINLTSNSSQALTKPNLHPGKPCTAHSASGCSQEPGKGWAPPLRAY